MSGLTTYVKVMITGAAMLACAILAAGTPAAGQLADSPPAGEKCPVCGMFVARTPDWISLIEFRDGERVYFDGPRDMFRFYLELAKYRPEKKGNEVTGLHVKEYYGLSLQDARQAFFVTGSDIYGPMGNELVPFANEEDAREFMRDHKGKKILTFGDVTKDVLRSLELQ